VAFDSKKIETGVAGSRRDFRFSQIEGHLSGAKEDRWAGWMSQPGKTNYESKNSSKQLP
jgi:hypothetical protein